VRNGVGWDCQAMQSLGYRQWKDYFEGTKTKDEVINKWIKGEQKYLKRQMTWFKKDKRINWFDVEDLLFKENVEKLVRKWYSSE
jgi:tRNA dimethylallyltransferase